MTKINICIIHYNTPKLTECLVRSINKFVPESTIYIFDNSDEFPFTYRQDNIVYYNNTKGQIINFDNWLKSFPDKIKSGGRLNKWGSAKHCYSVQKCFDLINEPFILLDSDIILKKDISELYDENSIYVSEVVNQPSSSIKRVLPFVCFINVPLCKKNKITYFNSKRMHGLRVTLDGDRYDTGSNFYIEAQKLPHKEIRYENYCVHFGKGSWKKNIAFEQHKFLEKYKNLWYTGENGKMNKKVIYTCITGSYELLEDPVVISKGYDYICFTDYDKIKSSIWEIRSIPKDLDGLSEVKKQRCIKINPHKYLPEYDFSIWVDGCVKLKKDVNGFVNENCKEGNIFIPSHPNRKCIYDEMNACIKMKKDTEANIEKQRSRYKNEQFPKNYGLVQSNIVIRYHNEPDCIRLMETWWKEVKNGSHRDQLSFDYARWKNSDVKFKFLDKNTCKSPYFWWDQTHGKGLLKKTFNSAFKILDIEPEKKPKIVKIPAVTNNNATVRRTIPSKKLREFLELS